MKICILTYTYSPYSKGGADMYAENISKQLSDKGHEVIVIAAKPTFDKSLSYTIEERDGIKIYWFYPLNVSSFYNIAKKSSLMQGIWRLLDIWNFHSYYIVKKILKKEMPDVVHAHTPVGLSPSVFKAVKSLGIPFVFTLHDYYLICPRITLLRSNGDICKKPNVFCEIYRLFNRYPISLPDVIIANSNFTKKIHVDAFNSKNINVFYCGIENIDYINKDILGVKNYNAASSLNILYIGQLKIHKGVHILIDAFKKIRSEQMHLHIVGDGDYRIFLEKLSNGDDRIMFHGRCSNREILQLYDECDIVVVPSIWYEPFGIVIQEAFRQGVPVIASDIGGIKELIQEGYNGFLFESGNLDQLKNKLDMVMNNPIVLNKMQKNALNSVEKYDMTRHIAELEKLYETISYH